MIDVNVDPVQENSETEFAQTGIPPEHEHGDAEFQWHPEHPVSVCATPEGLCLMMLGVGFPLFVIASASVVNFEGIWRLALLRPFETLVEAAALLSIPAGNYAVWGALCYKDSKHPIRNGLLNGFALGTACSILVVTCAALILGYPLIGADQINHFLSFSILAGISALSAIISLCLADKARRSKETVMARVRTVGYSVAGVLLSVLALGGSEARPTLLRVSETLAVSDNVQEQAKGLKLLRDLNPEKDIRLNCADPRTAGVAGLFLRLPQGAQQQLYFAATGKPFRDRKTTNMALMSNDYLRRHVVGPTVEGLSLVRSAIHGNVHSDTLSASMDWTFVFKNKGYNAAEARAEIALPDGAILSGLTLWINGEPRKAIFGATDKVKGSYNWVDVSHQDPALLTDLGRGRYLLQCSPVPEQGELKVSVKITEPLKLDGPEDLSMALPRFIDNNFAVSGQHSLRLRSTQRVSLTLNGNTSSATPDGDALLASPLKDDDLTASSFAIRVHDGLRRGAVAVADPTNPKDFIIEQIKEVQAASPRRLVVVVDGSKAVSGHVEGIKNALARLPEQIDTKILIASDDGEPKLFPLEEGLKRLRTVSFNGGRDNLEALVKAAEFAGEGKGGAVLWIHGPQPGFNDEMYIMAPYAAAPKFFELALDDCWTDANELFRNHREIGPFTAIVRNANVQDDLAHFFQRWQPGAKELSVELVHSKGAPTCPVVTGPQGEELGVLLAYSDSARLIKQGKTNAAAEIAVARGLVTPVTGAVVLERQNQGKVGLQTTAPSGTAFDAPLLGGGTNGTISAQGSGVIMGINTAGTVRVNNLANLEALCNLLANGGELIGLGLGAFNIILGALGRPWGFLRISAGKRIVVGLCTILVGLCIPGSINWLIASARDANMFD